MYNWGASLSRRLRRGWHALVRVHTVGARWALALYVSGVVGGTMHLVCCPKTGPKMGAKTGSGVRRGSRGNVLST